MNEIVSLVVGGIAIIIGVCSIFAYPRLQYLAVRQLRGVWLWLSLAPLCVMACVAVFTASTLSEGSNLWPLMLIFTAPIATAYLLVLRFAERRVIGRRGSVRREG